MLAAAARRTLATAAAVRVHVNRATRVTTVLIDRPERKNAVDGATARELAAALRAFDEDAEAHVAVLGGTGGTFCAGADLLAVASGDAERMNRLEEDGDGPMGPSRMLLSKPVVAAIDGHAVAGGLELALWCDLRVVERTAVMGVFCRRVGVPLIDGGTVRLPALIGLSRALDLILTGRPVAADEALAIGLANRVVEPGTALAEAEKLAAELAALPQGCMRADRASAYNAAYSSAALDEALRHEFVHGVASVSAEGIAGATRFAGGAGRSGKSML